MKVFTMRYQPFIMGGNVWQPVCCDVEVEGPYELGLGYKGYVVTAPNGKTFVAEASTGAFVGPDVKSVKNDIETGDQELMKKQVSEAAVLSKKASEVSAEEFWGLLKCNI
jgi:hypothetical protein